MEQRTLDSTAAWEEIVDECEFAESREWRPHLCRHQTANSKRLKITCLEFDISSGQMRRRRVFPAATVREVIQERVG
jgi:hypothetical protein